MNRWINVTNIAYYTKLFIFWAPSYKLLTTLHQIKVHLRDGLFIKLKFHNNISFIWIFWMYGVLSTGTDDLTWNCWSLIITEVKLGCIFFILLTVNHWINTIWNIGRQSKKNIVVIFKSDMVEHKQNVFIENVDWGKMNEAR